MVPDTSASVVHTNQGMIEKANLKETSLYHLAQLAGIPDETQFVQHFIDYERSLGA
jgi:energy-coupling factor transport system ATP-binding protein